MSTPSEGIPRKYDASAIEDKWCATWNESGLYAWNPEPGRDETFVVDTPPPTVSGSLHVGHLFSYSHQDFIVRFQRMLGKNIFFPIGWDDNGLPTERRVQNLYNVRCEPHLHYEPKLERGRGTKGEPLPISRCNFIELCNEVTPERRGFSPSWTRLGLVLRLGPRIGPPSTRQCRSTSQKSFLEILERGDCYQDETP